MGSSHAGKAMQWRASACALVRWLKVRGCGRALHRFGQAWNDARIYACRLRLIVTAFGARSELCPLILFYLSFSFSFMLICMFLLPDISHCPPIPRPILGSLFPYLYS